MDDFDFEFDSLDASDIEAAVNYHKKSQKRELPHLVSLDILTKKYHISEEDANKLTDKIMGAFATSSEHLEPIIDRYACHHFTKLISVYDSDTLKAAVRLAEKLNVFSQINLVNSISDNLKTNGIEGFNPDLLVIEKNESDDLIVMSYCGQPIPLTDDKPLLASSQLIYALNAFYFGNDNENPLIDQIIEGILGCKYQFEPVHFNKEEILSGSYVIENELEVHSYGLYETQDEGETWRIVQDYDISAALAKALRFEVSHVQNDDDFQALLDRWDYVALSDEQYNSFFGKTSADLS